MVAVGDELDAEALTDEEEIAGYLAVRGGEADRGTVFTADSLPATYRRHGPNVFYFRST